VVVTEKRKEIHPLKNRKLALALSCLYCGFGQIYKGEILKGIDLIFIYSMLIWCYLSSLAVLSLIGTFAIPLIWAFGVVDAYVREKDYNPQNWKWCLLFVLLAEIIVAPILLFGHGYLVSDTKTIINTGDINIPPQLDVKVEEQQESQVQKSSPDQEASGEKVLPEQYYTVLVGSFRVETRANNLHNTLLAKGYSARIELVEIRNKGLWYRVVVGEFASREAAKVLAEQFYKKERLSCKVIKTDK